MAQKSVPEKLGRTAIRRIRTRKSVYRYSKLKADLKSYKKFEHTVSRISRLNVEGVERGNNHWTKKG